MPDPQPSNENERSSFAEQENAMQKERRSKSPSSHQIGMNRFWDMLTFGAISGLVLGMVVGSYLGVLREFETGGLGGAFWGTMIGAMIGGAVAGYSRRPPD